MHWSRGRVELLAAQVPTGGLGECVGRQVVVADRGARDRRSESSPSMSATISAVLAPSAPHVRRVGDRGVPGEVGSGAADVGQGQRLAGGEVVDGHRGDVGDHRVGGVHRLDRGHRVGRGAEQVRPAGTEPGRPASSFRPGPAGRSRRVRRFMRRVRVARSRWRRRRAARGRSPRRPAASSGSRRRSGRVS